MRETFTRCLEAEARRNPNLVLITGDLGFGVLFPFMKEFPGQFLNGSVDCGTHAFLLFVVITERASATMMMRPDARARYVVGTFKKKRMLEEIAKISAPATAPNGDPRPPDRAIPPRTTAAMESSAMLAPMNGSPDPVFARTVNAAMPMNIDANTKLRNVTEVTGTSEA